MSWLFGKQDDTAALRVERQKTESMRLRALKHARDLIKTLHATLTTKMNNGGVERDVAEILRVLQEINERRLLHFIPESVVAAYRNNALQDAPRLIGRDLRADYEKYIRAVSQCLRQVTVEQQRGAIRSELQEYLDHADNYLQRLAQVEIAIRRYEEQRAHQAGTA